MGYKRLLITFVLSIIGFIGFSSSGYIDFNNQYSITPGQTNVGTGQCVFMASNYSRVKLYQNGEQYTLNGSRAYCFTSPGYIENTSSSNKTVMFFNILSEYPTCDVCETQYTSEECQQEYSLMPIASCDIEYCEMNDLCSTIGGSGSSTLYINDIWHESAPFIYVNIPEEFKRDYLTGEQEFTINVEGYNTDPDYIAGIINTQKTTPNEVDLNNIITGVLPLLVPGLVILLFIRFIFRFIKKVF